MNIIFILTLLTLALSAEAKVGVISVVKGSTQHIHFNQPPQIAKVGINVEAGDRFITSKDSWVQITANDKSKFRIEPNSEFVFKGTNEKAEIDLQLNKGKIRANFQKIQNNAELKLQHKISTPTAVSGVRGTDFLMTFNTESEMTKVVLFEGEVKLSSTDKSITKTEILKPGDISLVSKSAAPFEPVKLQQAALQFYKMVETDVKKQAPPVLAVIAREAQRHPAHEQRKGPKPPPRFIDPRFGPDNIIDGRPKLTRVKFNVGYE